MLKKLKKYREEKRNTKLLKILGSALEGKALDISCGDGAFLNLLQKQTPKLDLYGVDITELKINKAKILFPSIQFSQTSSDNLPFSDKSFDYILCTMSIHHYENLNKTLEEITRILKIGGILYLTDIMPKNYISQKIYNFFGCYEPYHFEKFYTTAEIVQIMSNARLELETQIITTKFPRLITLKTKRV